MNKRELSEIISLKTDLKLFETYYFIDLLIEVFKESFLKGEKIVISNFGTFYVKTRKKKKVMNPQTHMMMIIPKTKIIKFKPAKNFEIK